MGRESIVVRPGGDGRPPGAGTLGLALFLVSLGVLFAGCIVAYLMIRLRADEWPPPDSPGLPPGLWLSTLLLLGCSAAVQWGWSRIRRGDSGGLQRGLLLTLLLALAFCASQLWSWRAFLAGETAFHKHLYGFTFYMLTGLHGLHIVGGIVGLLVVLFFARRGAYSWAFDRGVRFAACYWHFVGAAWIVLFGVLLLNE